MTYKEIIKKSILNGFNYADISTVQILITLLITFMIACYIFFIYRMVTKSSFYSKSFNVSMAAIAVVTAAIILAMQSSIVISLGMVGALSIVRFRTAIKDPMDLLFLFWSIGTGIICGAGLFEIALLLAVLLTIAIFILDLLPERKNPYVLVINCNTNQAEEKVIAYVKKHSKRYRVDSRNATKDGLDLVMELRADREQELISNLLEMDEVVNVSLMTNSGEVRI